MNTPKFREEFYSVRNHFLSFQSEFSLHLLKHWKQCIISFSLYWSSNSANWLGGRLKTWHFRLAIQHFLLETQHLKCEIQHHLLYWSGGRGILTELSLCYEVLTRSTMGSICMTMYVCSNAMTWTSSHTSAPSQRLATQWTSMSTSSTSSTNDRVLAGASAASSSSWLDSNLNWFHH